MNIWQQFYKKENLFDEIQSIVNKIEIGKTYEKIEEFIDRINNNGKIEIEDNNFSTNDNIIRNKNSNDLLSNKTKEKTELICSKSTRKLNKFKFILI